VTFVGVLQPGFLRPTTLLQLASDTAVLFVLAAGVTFVIMLGGIDLSLQTIASLGVSRTMPGPGTATYGWINNRAGAIESVER
jgi:ribose/xylose/arabinose/galactoside ABC-type transport system permease subunit